MYSCEKDNTTGRYLPAFKPCSRCGEADKVHGNFCLDCAVIVDWISSTSISEKQAEYYVENCMSKNLKWFCII